MIAFAADLHLSPTIWAELPDMRGDAYNALHQIIDYCLKNKAEALLLGGDIFDKSKPDSLSVRTFKDEIGRLPKKTRKLAIQGQHDRSSPPWFELVPEVSSIDGYDPITLNFDGKDHLLYGFDNTHADDVKQKLEALKECDILMLHQALKSVMSIEGAWNLDEEWIPDFVKVALLGDLHVEASVGKCHYSGSTHIRSMKENPQKSFISVHHSGKKMTVKRHKIHGRPTSIMTIDSPETLDATVELIETELAVDSLMLARVSPDVPEAYKRLGDACRERSVHLRIRDLPVLRDDAKLDKPTEFEVGLEQCLGRVVNREETPELYSFLLRTLRAADAAEELAAVKNEMGITS